MKPTIIIIIPTMDATMGFVFLSPNGRLIRAVSLG